MTDHQSYICETCQRVLDVYTGADGVELRHTPQDPDDHDVKPVLAPPGWAGGRCDFCSATPPAYILPARDFRVPGRRDMSMGNWAACEKCGELIKFRRWADVERRAVAAQRRRVSKFAPAVRQLVERELRHEDVATRRLFQSLYTSADLWVDPESVHRLYRRLRQNITGPLRPITQEGEANS